MAQRVSEARVTVGEKTVGEIGPGLLLLVGAGEGDSDAEVRWMADKCAHLRIFEDDEGRFNLSLLDKGGSALVVSQFTLYGDCRKGRRPSFSGALDPAQAERLVEAFAGELRGMGVEVSTGTFGAKMDVHLVNHGPVTMIIEYP